MYTSLPSQDIPIYADKRAIVDTTATSTQTTFRTRVKNAAQLILISTTGQRMKCGKEAMNDICLVPCAGFIVAHTGLIAVIGRETDLAAYDAKCTYDHIVDATGMVVLPGLCDAHTHPVWAGDRVNEFALKLAGASYMQVHQAGGGIGFTVSHTHAASEEELSLALYHRLHRMLRHGTTLIEAKSGYGLDTLNEIKMLKVLHQANHTHPIDIVANYCGGHSVPKGSTAAAATDDIINNQLPAIQQAIERKEISPELIDVFCEKNVFEYDDTKRILEAGMKAGLKINFHGDELSYIKAGELAGELGAMAVSHCEHVSPEGITAMASRGVVGVLLPTTAYILRIPYPPARTMIDSGVPIALGSDFNPNAHCLSMPHVMNLACVNMHMTLEEALNAATINAAASMGRAATHGSIEIGKHADFIILRSERWEHLVYQMIDPPIVHVYKDGLPVYTSAHIEHAPITIWTPPQTRPKRRKYSEMAVESDGGESEPEVEDDSGLRPPTRPLSAYMLYVKDHRERVMKEHPSYNPDMTQPPGRTKHIPLRGWVGQQLGKEWSQLSQALKAPYHEKHRMEKQRYEQELRAYEEAKKNRPRK